MAVKTKAKKVVRHGKVKKSSRTPKFKVVTRDRGGWVTWQIRCNSEGEARETAKRMNRFVNYRRYAVETE